MKAKLEKWTQSIKKRDDFSFFVIAFLFIILFLYVPITGDDEVLIKQYANLTMSDHWDLIVHDYLYWSSRVIVNFVVHVILGQNRLVWVVLNAGMVFVLMKSLSKLFVKANKKECNQFIGCMVMLYPVAHLGTAGWLTTYTTYFWPIAIGFAALIPIRKIIDHEKFKLWEYPIYALALIYAANEELEMVVILFLYIVFFVYFLCKKEIKIYYVIQTLLALGSMIFTMTAPGNGTRGDSEIINWFPEYKMLDFVDKVDLGFTSAMHEIVFGNYVFFIAVCLLMTIAVWRKYQDNLIRVVSAVPCAITILFGPLKDITEKLFSRAIVITQGVSNTGLVTVENYDSMNIFAHFFVLCIVAVTFVISIFLIFGMDYRTIFAVALLVSGTASRVAIGFSPTIWASSYRTFSAMFFAIIAIGVIVYAYLADKEILTRNKRNYVMYFLYAMAALTYLNSWYTVVS